MHTSQCAQKQPHSSSDTSVTDSVRVGAADPESPRYRTGTNLRTPMFWHKVLNQWLIASTFNQTIGPRFSVFTESARAGGCAHTITSTKQGKKACELVSEHMVN
jgi:hypothetical protein